MKQCERKAEITSISSIVENRQMMRYDKRRDYFYIPHRRLQQFVQRDCGRFRPDFFQNGGVDVHDGVDIWGSFGQKRSQKECVEESH